MGRWGVNSVNNLHLQRIHSWPRAIALHCLLTQAGHSLTAQKKQMAVPLLDDQSLVLHSWPPRWRAPLPADAGGPFVNGAEKTNGRPTLGRPLVFSMRSLH